ncbi:hypothetical protein LPTSP4_31470 [Leptospira ryugenii]|uniref:Uncharacterized protein n=1 Tax=Leptospira ryugenii TaxID=1917863 RepID=A0A2P2E405_9LEPT|nr:hypothetical protein [Leptospira ryugenii]GBF51609.1 hypothetical protein LPTSP4_31470 [Leptospira ryugenii]
MKKNISLLVVFAFFVQTAFAESIRTQSSVPEVARSIVKSGMSVKEANAYVQAHVSPAEYARITKAIKDAEFAGTLDQDWDKIVSSVKLQKATGSYLHGDNFDVFKNTAASITVVALVGLIISSGGATTLATGKLYEASVVGL